MSKFAKIMTGIALLIGLLVAAEVLGEVFSTKLNKYYKVDCK